MSSYNLDENVEEFVEIILDGHTYRLRYPTTEEVFKFDAEHKGQPAEKQLEAFQEWIYSLVSSDEGVPPIKDVLLSKNLKVMQRFNENVRREFGLNG